MQPTPNLQAPYENPMHQDNTMHQGISNPDLNKKQMLEMCQTYQHHFVQFEATDGNIYEGIIEGSEGEYVNLLVPDGDRDVDSRQYLFGGYSYGGYPPFGGYPYGYGYPRRFRRFRRHRFPFYALRRLLFPFFY